MMSADVEGSPAGFFSAEPLLAGGGVLAAPASVCALFFFFAMVIWSRGAAGES
jgi:hypothetical protein